MRNYFGRLAALCFVAALFSATTISAQSYVPLHIFSTATLIYAPLVQGPDGTFYGVSSAGGLGNLGAVFQIQPDGSRFAILHSFSAGSMIGGHNTNADGATPVASLVLSNSVLYGTTKDGGPLGFGTVFKINTDGSGFADLHFFTNGVGGATPMGGLVLSGGALYGSASAGGSGSVGTLFKVNIDGTGFTNIYTFSGAVRSVDGAFPMATMILSGSTLYGTTEEGGTNSSGTVFKIGTNGTGYATLYPFSTTVSGTNSDGKYPLGSLVLSGGTLYGTASVGGRNYGTVFAVNTNGSGFTNLYTFTNGNDGSTPDAGLVLSGNTLYGTASAGGPSPGWGTVFKLNTDGSSFTNLYDFAGSNDGAQPHAGLVLSGAALYGTTLNNGSQSGGGNIFKLNTDGTGFAVLGDGSDGAKPQAGLVLSGSAFYGTTAAGGVSGNGTVFRVNTNGTGSATLYAFTAGDYEFVSGVLYHTNTDGSTPMGTLVLSGGSLYGTARIGGRFGVGTVFRLNTDGTGFTNLYTFTNGMDGALPMAGLVLSGSTLYGTASAGGGGLSGTVFQINTNGTGFALVHTFSAGTVYLNIYTNADGALPSASLLLAGDTLYGTTYQGGPLGGGTLFKVNTNGTGFTNFYNFIAAPNGDSNADGANPAGSLVLSGNTLYGTAAGGGIGIPKTGFSLGTMFKVNTDGTGFVRLHLFTGRYDGGEPVAGLALSGSTLYGTASTGSSGDAGTLFQVSTDGTGFTTLHTFGLFQGGTPAGDLVLVGNTLYGTSEYSAAGGSGSGTVFAVTPTSAPSIQFTASPTNGIPPQTVQFNAPGVDDKGNPISFWNWNFGDGSTNATQNPVHTYTNNAVFTPSLIATNNNGATIIGSGPSITVAYARSILNGGFETGNFTNWTGSGNLSGRSVTTGATYAHAGTYGARLVAFGSLGYLSQTIATTPGMVYSISFWLDSPSSLTPNEFLVSWNGSVLFDKTNLTAIGWTNMQFLVTATGSNTVLQFGFRNDYSFFGLDQISVGLAQPDIVSFSLSGTNLVVSNTGGLSGRTYHLLMGTNVMQPLIEWTPVATNVPGADGNFSITATNAVDPNAPQRFYILQMQ